MNTGFTVEAILTKCSSMVDRGLAVGFHTRELSVEDKAKVMQFHNRTGYLLFKANEIEEQDVPKTQAEMNTKTPSQRLRAVLFVYWQQQGIKEEFDIFYQREMEKIINEWKEKLL